MGVTKYRSVADMPPVQRASGHDLAQMIRIAWSRSRRLWGAGYTPGVQKFSSIEEMQKDRENEERARIRRLRQKRQPK